MKFVYFLFFIFSTSMLVAQNDEYDSDLSPSSSSSIPLADYAMFDTPPPNEYDDTPSPSESMPRQPGVASLSPAPPTPVISAEEDPIEEWTPTPIRPEDSESPIEECTPTPHEPSTEPHSVEQENQAPKTPVKQIKRTNETLWEVLQRRKSVLGKREVNPYAGPSSSYSGRKQPPPACF